MRNLYWSVVSEIYFMLYKITEPDIVIIPAKGGLVLFKDLLQMVMLRLGGLPNVYCANKLSNIFPR